MKRGAQRIHPWFAGQWLLVLSILALRAAADPWLDPGDTALRHDLTLLADLGLIDVPLTQWPLSWGDVEIDNDRIDASLPPHAAAAVWRLRARLRDARRVGEWRPGFALRGGTDPWVLRGFEDTPREQAVAEAGLRWTGERFAVRLRGQYAWDAADDNEWRADGSYAGLALGNWILAAAVTDRWWGPGWQGSMILSSNARPIPALTIDRNSTRPFETRWLRWLGRWDLITMFGFLEEERAVPDAWFFGMRLTIKPRRWLEIGLSRSALWCGDGRPCDLETFGNLLLGRDNAGDNVSAGKEPGDQLAGYDIRLTGAGLGWPVALYFQQIGEDEQDLQPALFLTQLGVETWGAIGDGYAYRIFAELADTLCGGNLFGGGQPDVCYNHPIYQTGVRFRGRSIGHAADNDAKLLTVGALLNEPGDASWSLMVTGGELNRALKPDRFNTVSAVPADYLAASLTHCRPLPLGRLQLGFGYEQIDRQAGGKNDDFRVFLNWSSSD